MPDTIPTSEPQTRPTTTATNLSTTADEHIESQTIRLAGRTPVHLFLAETISSNSAQAGDSVKLQVLGDIKVGNLVVIANKAPAIGRVETVQSAGRAWRAGRLIIQLQTVTLINQKEQPLEAWNASKGADTGAASNGHKPYYKAMASHYWLCPSPHCSMGIRLFFIRELNSRPSPVAMLIFQSTRLKPPSRSQPSL